MTTNWGRWKFDPVLKVLTHEIGYEVDLETFVNSASALDWVFQVTGKMWMTPEDIRDFLEAIRELINPQANLCSFGADKSYKPFHRGAA